MKTDDRPGGPASGSDGPSPIDVTTIRSGAASLDCFVVPWDSQIFGFEVAEITRLERPGDASDVRLFEAFDEWCTRRDIRLITCRLDHSRLGDSAALEAHGFRFIEMVLQPRLALSGDFPAADLLLDVAEATEDDLARIEAIAQDAFTTGRYLLDRRLPPGLNGRRYARWVRSAFDSPSQTVLKAVHDGELVGFFCVERQADGNIYWHLTAVAPGWQGRGVGLSFWRTMLRRHAEDGATSVTTTISAHNLAAINLYARLGFSFAAAQMTFHRLVEATA